MPRARAYMIRRASMTIFEAVTLWIVALAGTLLLFVSLKTLDASDAMRIYMLLGSFTSTLMTFYAPYDQGLRLWLAIAGIPSVYKATLWLFAPHPAEKVEPQKMHQL